MNTIRVSNSLDTDQDRHFVGLDLSTNCLQRLSADEETSKERVDIILTRRVSFVSNRILVFPYP